MCEAHLWISFAHSFLHNSLVICCNKHMICVQRSGHSFLSSCLSISRGVFFCSSSQPSAGPSDVQLNVISLPKCAMSHLPTVFSFSGVRRLRLRRIQTNTFWMTSSVLHLASSLRILKLAFPFSTGILRGVLTQLFVLRLAQTRSTILLKIFD